MKKNKRGFTIIELLVVIAIIAMLLSFVIVSLSDSKKKGRDSRREEDIKQIQNTLGLYVVNGHIYPVCSQGVINGSADCLSQALITSGFITQIPVDPLRKADGTCGAVDNYVYCYTSDGLDYTLEYALETDNILGKSSGWQSVSP